MQALGYFVAYELVKYTFCTRTYKYHCFYLQQMQIAWHSLAHSGLATLVVARGAIRSEGTRTNEFLLSILPLVVCIKYAYSLWYDYFRSLSLLDSGYTVGASRPRNVLVATYTTLESTNRVAITVRLVLEYGYYYRYCIRAMHILVVYYKQRARIDIHTLICNPQVQSHVR